MSKAVKDADELQERSNEEKILEKVSAMERRLDAIADRLKR
jgi:hypothetical protein